MPKILAIWKAEIERIVVWGQPRGRIVHEIPSPKYNQSKRDWICGLNDRVPALQVLSSEFKPQSHKKKILYCYILFSVSKHV
jgi:hypothetical protein